MLEKLTLAENLLASQVDGESVKGFFSKEIEIPWGTKALLLENGVNRGDLKPGKCTLQTFFGKVFGGRTAAGMKLFLLRDSAFEYSCGSTHTSKEGLSMEAEYTVRFVIENSALFVKNCLGHRTSYSLEQFQADTEPIVNAAMHSGIFKFSVKDMTNKLFEESLETELQSAVNNSLGIYGLKFDSLQLRTLKSAEQEQIQNREKDLWIFKENRAVTLQEQQVQIQERLENVRFQENLNDLEILEKQKAEDKAVGELAILQRRIECRREMRKKVQSDRFDKITNQAEMEQFLFEDEKTKLLREDEKKELIASLQVSSDEKEMRRANFIEKLKIQLDRDIEQYNYDYAHQLKMTALRREIELASVVEQDENRKWLASLQRQSQERDAEYQYLKDKSEYEKLEGLAAIEKAETQNRLETLNQIRMDEMHAHELARQKDQALMEAEIAQKTFATQLEKLQAMQALNHANDQHALDMEERREAIRHKRELELKEAERKHELETRRLELEKQKILAGMGPDAILTHLSPEQASVYAAVTASRMSAETAKAQAEMSKSTADFQSASEAAAQGRYEEQSKAMDTMSNFMKDILASQERTQDRMVQMHAQSQHPQQAPVVLTPGVQGGFVNSVPGAAPAQETSAARTLLCPHCRAEVSENAKFCPNCGKQL